MSSPEKIFNIKDLNKKWFYDKDEIDKLVHVESSFDRTSDFPISGKALGEEFDKITNHTISSSIQTVPTLPNPGIENTLYLIPNANMDIPIVDNGRYSKYLYLNGEYELITPAGFNEDVFLDLLKNKMSDDRIIDCLSKYGSFTLDDNGVLSFEFIK